MLLISIKSLSRDSIYQPSDIIRSELLLLQLLEVVY